jgi:hypothetical protein
MGASGCPINIFESIPPALAGKQQGQGDNGNDTDDFHFFLLFNFVI